MLIETGISQPGVVPGKSCSHRATTHPSGVRAVCVITFCALDAVFVTLVTTTCIAESVMPRLVTPGSCHNCVVQKCHQARVYHAWCPKASGCNRDRRAGSGNRVYHQWWHRAGCRRRLDNKPRGRAGLGQHPYTWWGHPGDTPLGVVTMFIVGGITLPGDHLCGYQARGSSLFVKITTDMLQACHNRANIAVPGGVTTCLCR